MVTQPTQILVKLLLCMMELMPKLEQNYKIREWQPCLLDIQHNHAGEVCLFLNLKTKKIISIQDQLFFTQNVCRTLFPKVRN